MCTQTYEERRLSALVGNHAPTVDSVSAMTSLNKANGRVRGLKFRFSLDSTMQNIRLK